MKPTTQHSLFARPVSTLLVPPAVESLIDLPVTGRAAEVKAEWKAKKLAV